MDGWRSRLDIGGLARVITRQQIVAEARSWIGTPWHHHARIKGVGCDCIGFTRGVATELGIIGEDISSWNGVQRFLKYTQHPDGKNLLEACRAYLIPISKEKMQMGDVVLITLHEHPQHMGILGDYRNGGLSIIHASNDQRLMKVVEMRLMFSQRFRFTAAFSFPGV